MPKNAVLVHLPPETKRELVKRADMDCRTPSKLAAILIQWALLQLEENERGDGSVEPLTISDMANEIREERQ